MTTNLPVFGQPCSTTVRNIKHNSDSKIAVRFFSHMFCLCMMTNLSMIGLFYQCGHTELNTYKDNLKYFKGAQMCTNVILLEYTVYTNIHTTVLVSGKFNFNGQTAAFSSVA